MQVSRTISYPCGYQSNGEWKNRETAYTLQTTIINTGTIYQPSEQETAHHSQIVFNAVINNPKGNITDIYLDIMSTEGNRLGPNYNFQYEYQANYHRAYAEVNGHPYSYGGTIHRTTNPIYPPQEKTNCSDC